VRNWEEANYVVGGLNASAACYLLGVSCIRGVMRAYKGMGKYLNHHTDFSVLEEVEIELPI